MDQMRALNISEGIKEDVAVVVVAPKEGAVIGNEAIEDGLRFGFETMLHREAQTRNWIGDAVEGGKDTVLHGIAPVILNMLCHR
jgi:hypothetical protein